ncbi:hypothetical protein QG37_00017 [Candidozyma auris]|uniref:Uncharacterized protein n=1 Tax=Candidozyma auris TaxID=498019 RepID=A0A0L0P9F2_CANAR|nr:hypothetical protein QG37_00017 [[Candida] auris]
MGGAPGVGIEPWELWWAEGANMDSVVVASAALAAV